MLEILEGFTEVRKSIALTISSISSIHGDTQPDKSGFPTHFPFFPQYQIATPTVNIVQ